MLKFIAHKLCARRKRDQQQDQRDQIDAWSLQFGREAAELWVQALSVRDAARLFNA
jgi:hypothetical protein